MQVPHTNLLPDAATSVSLMNGPVPGDRQDVNVMTMILRHTHQHSSPLGSQQDHFSPHRMEDTIPILANLSSGHRDIGEIHVLVLLDDG